MYYKTAEKFMLFLDVLDFAAMRRTKSPQIGKDLIYGYLSYTQCHIDDECWGILIEIESVHPLELYASEHL